MLGISKARAGHLPGLFLCRVAQSSDARIRCKDYGPIGILARLLNTPPTVISIVRSGAVRTPAGIRMLTWFNPANPGAPPANSTAAATPSTVAVTGSPEGLAPESAPVATAGFSAPRPVPYTEITSLGCAGFSKVTGEKPSWCSAASCQPSSTCSTRRQLSILSPTPPFAACSVPLIRRG